MPSYSRAFWTNTLAATCLAAAALLSPAAAETKLEMVIAAPFGPKSSIPDPRARQNGWLSNRAGVSETLIGIGYDMTLQPRLATGFENLSEREWKITLREGVKFHDGSAVTAQAVKESFEKLSEEGHPGNNPRLVKLLNIESIELVDDKRWSSAPMHRTQLSCGR